MKLVVVVVVGTVEWVVGSFWEVKGLVFLVFFGMSVGFAVVVAGMGRKRTRMASELLSRVKVWHFATELVPAKLRLREKRFLAHCVLEDEQEITAHCPNPGAMIGFGLDTSPEVYLSKAADLKRKLQWTLEMVRVKDVWVGCNTMLPNRVVKAALEKRAFPDLQGYTSIRSEVAYGTEKSRVDFVLTYEDGSELFLEVKNVTLRGEGGKLQDVALFPDCQTLRGQKHLRELSTVSKHPSGNRKAALLFYINRTDVSSFAPSLFDPAYHKLFYEATLNGVQPLPYIFDVDPLTGDVFLHPNLLPIQPNDVVNIDPPETPPPPRRSRRPRKT